MLLVTTTNPILLSKLTSCKKMGEMSNNINNQPLYSMGLYMCIELPNTQSIENPILPPLLPEIKETIQNLSNSTFTNQLNYNNFTNSTKNITEYYNSSHIIKNSTNISTTLIPTTPISVPPTPSPTTTPLPATPSPTTTPLPTTPSPTTLLPTIPSPTTNKPPDPTTSSPTPSPITRQDPIIPTKNQPPNINNTQNGPFEDKKQDLNVPLENNPLLPIVITLSSLIILVFCVACCKWLYNKRKLKKISCNKPDKNQEPDIESGEKKNRNSWVTHKNLARDKLRAMQVFKGGRKNKNKSKAGLKPRLQQIPKKQEEAMKKIKPKIKRIPPPGVSTAKSTLKGLNNKQRNNVRNTLLETAKTMPQGQNNPRLQAMLKKFPEEPVQPMDDENKKWYKEEFHTELDIINKRPLTLPPPLPVPSFDGKSQPPRKIVHSNPNNKKSPKMVISELNPETNIQYLN